MRNALKAVLFFLVVGLFSCQKEVDDIFANNGNGGGNASGLLVKTIAVTGSDSLTTLYSYDHQNRLETITIDGFSNGMQMHTYKHFIRDGSSRIATIRQVMDQNGTTSDTTIETVHYPGSGMEFDYTLNAISMLGVSLIDSSVYTYSSGRMTSMESRLSSPLIGPAPLMMTKTEFAYDGSGNVTLLKMYSDLGTGTLSPLMNQAYTYGDAVSATWISGNGAQNFLLYGTPATGNKAFVTAQVDDFTTPSASFSLTASYNLDSDGKLKSATITSTSGQVTNYTFYYQ